MKNIHLLRTNLSRLYYSISMSGYNLKLSTIPYHQSSEIRPQHLYITSDEEIKPNTYCLINGVLCKTEIREGKIVSRQLTGGATMDICKSEYLEIILTTDNRLIADGVQSIDDDFLEWFVKNPSCESVEVKLINDSEDHPELVGNPKEEWSYYDIIIPKETPKQETLEEAAEKYAEPFDNRFWVSATFKEGAEWQQERMYSEEEVKDLIEDWTKMASGLNQNFPLDKFNIWFEQFKK